MDIDGTPTQEAVQGFVRDQNVRVLERALMAEADPDDRRILRRLLREQERLRAEERRSRGRYFPQTGSLFARVEMVRARNNDGQRQTSR